VPLNQGHIVARDGIEPSTFRFSVGLGLASAPRGIMTSMLDSAPELEVMLSFVPPAPQ